MNEIVKYNNEFNTLRLTGFNSVDLDLLMVLCAKVKEKQTEKLRFSFQELKTALGMVHQSDKYFLDQLYLMNKKLISITCSFITDKGYSMFVLFTAFTGNLETKELVVSVNPDFAYLLNDLTTTFTRFELAEFAKLESKYSKNLYRLLKQYRRTGTYRVSADKFREYMDCPESYPNKEFMRVCVNVAVRELSRGYFDNLQVIPIRGMGRGRTITAYEFTFKPSKEIPGQMSIADYDGVVPDPEGRKPKGKRKSTKFSNFQERKYDFDEYERQLLLTNEQNEE